MITKRPIEVCNIRAGRQNPGLRWLFLLLVDFVPRSQHAAALELASRVCCGHLSSCAVGSTEIRLIPGQISPGSYEADAKTAGYVSKTIHKLYVRSVSLMLQAVAPVLAFASNQSELLLRGGTDTLFAPPINYMIEVTYKNTKTKVCQVTSHYFRKMGLVCEVKVVRR